MSALAVLSCLWAHRGTAVRAVDLVTRAPSTVADGRWSDVGTEARAVHALELQVERLKAQSDFGECLTQFSKSIERLIERIPTRAD